MRNNSLACVQFIQGNWVGANAALPYFGDISRFVAAADSRHLSVSIVNETATSLDVALLFESKDGVTLLNGNITVPVSSVEHWSWTWTDITAELEASLTTDQDLRFGAPFTLDNTASDQAVFIGYYQNGSFSGQTIMTSFSGTGSSPGLGKSGHQHGSCRILLTCTASITTDLGAGDFQGSDLLILDLASHNPNGINAPLSNDFFVNGTSLAPIAREDTSLLKMPQSSFPYKRLAGLSTAGGNNLLVYHQVNGSAFAEEMWDQTVGGWTSNIISMA